MTAPYKYKYEPWTKICSSDDWTVSALDFLGGRKGLTGQFKYSTLGIHILTGIISKTSGLKVVDFANKFLFEPIGVEKHINYLAETAEEHKHFTMCPRRPLRRRTRSGPAFHSSCSEPSEATGWSGSRR